MQWSNDIFDIIDDDTDELEYTTEQLSRYFQVGHINSMYDEEKMVEDDSFNDDTDVEVTIFVRRIYDITNLLPI